MMKEEREQTRTVLNKVFPDIAITSVDIEVRFQICLCR